MPAAVEKGGASASHIVVENARSHNLKGASCRIPLRALSVITGVSGSGKSTLAFDTLYAEGQRRFVTSLSTYARQFLERLPRPEVDHISNLPRAIAIERHNRVTGVRSIVGTATEILDYLRLLFAKIGETRRPECHLRVDRVDDPRVQERVVGIALGVEPHVGLEAGEVSVRVPVGADGDAAAAGQQDSGYECGARGLLHQTAP